MVCSQKRRCHMPRSWRFIPVAERYSVLGIAFEKAFL